MRKRQKTSGGNPKLQEAFGLGTNCFTRGKLNNPFKKNSVMYREWQRGFDTAYFNNLQRVVH